MPFLDAGDIGTLVGEGIDALVAYVLYRFYKSSSKSAEEVHVRLQSKIGFTVVCMMKQC